MTRLGTPVALLLALLVVMSGGRSLSASSGGTRAEVVVLLESPPLVHAPGTTKRIATEQSAFRRALAARSPSARIGWRYRLVANGFSVSVARRDLGALHSLPGVREVVPAASYGPQLDHTPPQIGAPGIWGPGLESSGQGIKIAILDSGIDPSHAFFDPSGYEMPAGFPKGQRQFTSAKIIVARVFAPAGLTTPGERVAFDESDSPHGTHVAGIAAGNAETPADGRTVSGVAPGAYIGNYKVFVPTEAGVSPNANSPALVAAIEAAVADGMDVINFSGGEPEIEPSRDIVALALDAAAAAGVVPVVAAGNDYNDFGAGSVSSPANAERAIAVGAVAVAGSPPQRVHADFSSVGPTTLSLRLKPDVAAPGIGVLSSVPDGWSRSSGTSMASPHIAGAAALLIQRHPDWTPDQVKSALVQTGNETVGENGRPLGPRFQGGGVVALGRADRPLLFATPSAVSLGLLTRGSRAEAAVALEDAGGGAGTWTVSRVLRAPAPGLRVTLPPTVTVPGELPLEVSVTATAPAGDLDGYVELHRGETLRRIPLWGRVTVQALARHRSTALLRPGLYRSTTAGRPALVSRYRYPENPRGTGLTTVLWGRERVYRVKITRPVANFGVVIVKRGANTRVEPRVVVGLDESRLTGYAGLPVVYNPYLDQFRDLVLAAGALSPRPGEFSIVFDSASRSGAGSFTFRYWVNDVTPPALKLLTPSVGAGTPIRVAATDAGSGVFAGSVMATLDGEEVDISFRDGVVSVSTRGYEPGTYRLRLRVSDYQESKNTENVARILPNTRTLMITVRIRP